MRQFISKKTIAMTMASAMIVSNCAVAFGDGVTGSSALEYDNSVAVTYDKVQVPTLSSNAYDITIDPNKELHKFRPSVYSDDTVFFYSLNSEAKIQTLDSSAELYKKTKASLDSAAGKWAKVIVTSGGEIETVNGGFYVWEPTFNSDGYTGGFPGRYTELTKSNIGNWFEVALDSGADSTIQLKEEYLFNSDGTVCDGQLYTDTYEKVLTSDADGFYYVENDVFNSIKKFQSDGTSKTEFVDLYLDSNGTQLASGGDGGSVEFVEAESKYRSATNKVTVVNKSTRSKVVTATVTMNSAAGLTFTSDDTFNSGAADTSASLYLKATNSEDKDVVMGNTGTLTYTVTLDSAAGDGGEAEITYMDNSKNDKTGGHNYYRYEASAITYDSDSFWIEAKANPNAGAADAWEAYLSNINTTGEKPSLNVVYTVTNPSNDPVAAGIYYDSTNNEWWIGTTPEVGFAPSATVTSVTVNGDPIDWSVDTFDGKKFVVVKWSTYVAAGYDQAEVEYDFVVKVDGTNYAVHYTYE